MKHAHRNQEGIALLAATIFIAVALLILGAMALRAINQSRQVDQYQAFNDCLYGVESAIASSKADLELGNPGWIGLQSDWEAGEEGALPQWDDSGVAPLNLPNMAVDYFSLAQDWADDGVDNNGNGAVDEPDEHPFVTVYGFARNRGVQRQAEVVYSRVDVNVWRNAIFAGAGQAGGLVNGNVSIHGSVHLLGNTLPEGAEAIAALDMSGASLIHNNYTNCPADLLSRVPPLPTTNFNGEDVATLFAKLRVKNGLVSMSGNSEIGEPHVAGNGVKDTMDGTYVNDGWSGNSVIDDGDRGDPTAVFSDNGWDNRYDLADKVNMPFLSDDYREMGTGDRYTNPATGDWYQHDTYFSEVLSGAPYPGSLTIAANQNFYYNATRPTDTDPAHRLPTDDYILFNATTNRMEVNGQIEINGDLTITRGGGNDKTIYYTGRSALLVNGNVTLNTDLLTLNPDGTSADSFPRRNILGIMARQNMTVGALSQLKLMGAFYAQSQIKSEKQTIVMGTFVSNFFDMGTNVPDIYQVPDLADYLPLGMIGAYPIWVLDKVSWREIAA